MLAKFSIELTAEGRRACAGTIEERGQQGGEYAQQQQTTERCLNNPAELLQGEGKVAKPIGLRRRCSW